MTQPCALYRHFDAEGRLLYVGISIDPNRRVREHSYESDWFDRVVTVKIERFPTQAEAAVAERAAVIAENPENNSIKFEGRKRRRLPPNPVAIVSGGQPVSWQVREKIIDRVTHTGPVKWWTVEGCAHRLFMDAEVLRDLLVFPYDKEVRLKRTDMLAVAYLAIKGELSQDTPWVVGRPLSEHMILLPRSAAA